VEAIKYLKEYFIVSETVSFTNSHLCKKESKNSFRSFWRFKVMHTKSKKRLNKQGKLLQPELVNK
jgi:hypothetical protein